MGENKGPVTARSPSWLWADGTRGRRIWWELSGTSSHKKGPAWQDCSIGKDTGHGSPILLSCCLCSSHKPNTRSLVWRKKEGMRHSETDSSINSASTSKCWKDIITAVGEACFKQFCSRDTPKRFPDLES